MANLPPRQTSYTFNGTTVSFSDTQQELLDADEKTISDAIDNLNNVLIPAASKQNAYDTSYSNHDECAGLPQAAYKNCENNRTNQLILVHQQTTQANQDVQDAIKSLDPTNPLSLMSKYNNDLIQAQNDIKLQIQAQQANQATANQNTLNQNSAQVNSQNTQIALQQSQLDAASSNQTKRYLLFFGVTVIVIGAAIIIIRKLL